MRWQTQLIARLFVVGLLLLGGLIGIGLSINTKSQPHSWARRFTTSIAGTLVVKDKIFATDQSGGFWQINANSGQTEAYLHLGLATTYQPFAINERLVGFVSNRGAVIAIDIESFTEAWRIETELLAEPELPQVDRNFLYFADRNRMVYVLDSTTGKLLWKKSFLSDQEPNTVASIKAVEYLPFYTDTTSLYVGSRADNQLSRCLLLTGECQVIRSNFDPTQQTLSVGKEVVTYTNTNQEYQVVELDSLRTLFRQKIGTTPIHQTDAIIFSVGQQLQRYSLTDHSMQTNSAVGAPIQSIVLSPENNLFGIAQVSPQTSAVFMTDQSSPTVSWQTTLSELCRPPTIFASIVIVPCQNQVYGLNTQTGEVTWQLPVLGFVEQIISPVSSDTSELVIVQTQTQAKTTMLYGIKKSTGTVLWNSPLISSTKTSLNPTDQGALMVANQGHVLLSLTDRVSKSFEWPPAVRTTAINELTEYTQQGTTDICPIDQPTKRTLKMRLLQIKNKINSVMSSHPITVSEIASSPALVLEVKGDAISTVKAKFWQNEASMEERNGFPIQHEKFQVRFLPPTTGTWFWELEVTSNYQKHTIQGTSKNLIIHQLNALTIQNQQWMRNATPFYGIGWQTCMLDYDFDGIWTDHWPVNTANTLQANASAVSTANATTYIQSMRSAGFNLMRLSLENCSPRLTQCLNNTELLINQQTSASVDEVLIQAKRNEMAVVFGIFGFEPWYVGVTNGKVSPTLAQYLDYVIARYGAYVDVWELANESTPNDEWITAVSEYLKAHDPYHHSVTISWERPDLAAIDSTQLHYYDSEPVSEITSRFLPTILQAKPWQKPVLIGESGNATVNSDPESLIRFTHKNWLSIFTNTPIIWWDQPDRLYYHPASANIYLGPAEKKAVSIAQTVINKYLNSPTQRQFVLADATQQPIWLGIETEQQVLLYAANPFSTQYAAHYDLIPPNLKLIQLILPQTGQVIPIQQLRTVPELITPSQPFVLILNRQL